MYTIHQNLKSVDIKYGTTSHFPNRSFVPVFSESDAVLKAVYISTPKLVLAWNKTFSNDDKTFNIEFSSESGKFIEKLKDFCSKTITRKFDKKTYDTDIHQIKTYPTNDAHTLRFYNIKLEDVSTYDENGSLISVHDVTRDDVVKILFHLNGLVVRGEKVQMDMRLIQMMKIQPYSVVNKTMTLLKTPKTAPTLTHAPIAPPPPPKLPPPPIANRNTKQNKKIEVMRSSLSSISKEDLLNAMSKLRKR